MTTFNVITSQVELMREHRAMETEGERSPVSCSHTERAIRDVEYMLAGSLVAAARDVIHDRDSVRKIDEKRRASMAKQMREVSAQLMHAAGILERYYVDDSYVPQYLTAE